MTMLPKQESLSPYQDGISNRERRSLKGPSRRQRRDQARAAQSERGTVIRIARKVVPEYEVQFAGELAVWREFPDDVARPRSKFGELALTVFDTGQQPPKILRADNVKDIEDLLEEEYPALFRPTPVIPVTGIARFGNDRHCHLGLRLGSGFVHDERLTVREAIAPGLALSDGHLPQHQMHLSLGQVVALSYVDALEAGLAGALPREVQFSPATVEVNPLR